MKKMTIITVYTIIGLSLFAILSSKYVFAGDFEGSSIISGSVKIGVCGDSNVEGVEQCEPLVPITQTCKDLGYDTGTLTCDPSCSYITSDCKYVKPQPQTPNYPNPFTPQPEPEVRNLLPFFFKLYDVNNDGRLSTAEYCSGLDEWLVKWKTRLLDPTPEKDITQVLGAKDTCDLNFDKNCDLKDLSIFLHNSQ